MIVEDKDSGTITVSGTDLEDLQKHAREQLEKMRPAEGTPASSELRTPYAVICREHGQKFLTNDEYMRQLCRPDALWTCPKCGEASQFDDDNYEASFSDGPDGPDEHDDNCAPNCACKPTSDAG
jgi:hypothetical protein